MKDWIKELCPEISDWQVELIDEAVQRAVAIEREACAKICEAGIHAERYPTLTECATKIRARGLNE